jgi:hypothetical protein
MRVTKQLEPIYYDSALFSDFLDELEKYSTVTDMKGSVEWDNRDTRVQFDDARQLIDDKTVPNRVLAFSVKLRAEEGRIEIAVDSTKGREFHRLIIDGEEEWVKQNLQNISDFENAQTETLRAFISNKRLTYLQFLLGGSLIATLAPHAITLHPVFDFPIPPETLLIAGGHILMIGLLEVPKRIYPYVVFTRNGTEPLHRAIISVLIPMLTLIGVVLSAVGLLT